MESTVSLYADSSRRNFSPLPGPVWRMFRSLPAAQFGSDDDHELNVLRELGKEMSATFDPPKDGKDDEESGIPALYTILGQFIDHDITFDPEEQPPESRMIPQASRILGPRHSIWTDVDRARAQTMSRTTAPMAPRNFCSVNQSRAVPRTPRILCQQKWPRTDR